MSGKEVKTVRIFLSVNEETNMVKGWGSTASPGSIRVEVEEDHEVMRRPLSYKYEDGKLVKDNSDMVRKAKAKKEKELSEACRSAIMAGFSCVIRKRTYFFSYDMEAQANFHTAEKALAKGMRDKVKWTVQYKGKYKRIPLSLKELEKVMAAALDHKEEQVDKLREERMPTLEKAKTIEDVKAITWDK